MKKGTSKYVLTKYSLGNMQTHTFEFILSITWEVDLYVYVYRRYTRLLQQPLSNIQIMG